MRNDPAILEELASVGARRAAVWLPSGPLSVVEQAVADWEQAIAEFTGRD